MKKSLVRILSLTMVALLLCVSFASCAALSGVYSAETDIAGLAGGKTSYNFKGSKNVTVTVTGTLLGQSSTHSYDGQYEIKKADDGTQSITFTFESDDASSYNGTYTFSQDKDANTITIGKITYTKAK